MLPRSSAGIADSSALFSVARDGGHLGDEEDLIVPLVLERGEDDLGVS